MKICITLDDVLRNKTYQICNIYKKKLKKDIVLEELDLSTDDFTTILGFKDKKTYEKFLYEDYPFEIFAEAPVCEKMLDKKLNLWLLNLDDNDDLKENVEVSIANPYEFNASIGNTCFFLSKIAPRIREFYFPSDSQKIWDRCDVLITADKKLLANKPSNKVSIKIETDYNKECEADYTYGSLLDFLNDEEIIIKIQTSKNKENE